METMEYIMNMKKVKEELCKNKYFNNKIYLREFEGDEITGTIKELRVFSIKPRVIIEDENGDEHESFFKDIDGNTIKEVKEEII